MLPRYVVARKRPNGTVYYWQVPPAQRIKSSDGVWPAVVIRLPDNEIERAAEAARLNAQLDQLRAGHSSDAYRRGTMPWLIAQYEQSGYYADLRPRTKSSYMYLSRRVQKWSQSKGHPPVANLTTPKVLEFLAQFETRKSLRDHIVTYLNVVLEYAKRTGLITTNPARQLRLKRARRLKAIRTVSVEQVLAIVDKAKELGKPHVAMGVLLHFDLGQRQGDVLRLQKPRDYKNGVFHFKQSKTDQVVTIRPFMAETRAALDALPAEQMMLVAKNKLAVSQKVYAADFREVADACGFTDLWEMELRHSCVIYCEQAGLTPAEIATRTGHGLASVMMILANYRYRDNVVASQGAIKLEDYRNKVMSK